MYEIVSEGELILEIFVEIVRITRSVPLISKRYIHTCVEDVKQNVAKDFESHFMEVRLAVNARYVRMRRQWCSCGPIPIKKWDELL